VNALQRLNAAPFHAAAWSLALAARSGDLDVGGNGRVRGSPPDRFSRTFSPAHAYNHRSRERSHIQITDGHFLHRASLPNRTVSSSFCSGKVGSMFLRVNLRCAHHVRPPPGLHFGRLSRRQTNNRKTSAATQKVRVARAMSSGPALVAVSEDAGHHRSKATDGIRAYRVSGRDSSVLEIPASRRRRRP